MWVGRVPVHVYNVIISRASLLLLLWYTIVNKLISRLGLVLSLLLSLLWRLTDCEIVVHFSRKGKPEEFRKFTMIEMGVGETDNFVDFIRYLKRQYIDSTAVKLGLVDYSLDLSCKTKHPSGSEREYKVDTTLEWKAVKNRLLSHQENIIISL